MIGTLRTFDIRAGNVADAIRLGRSFQVVIRRNIDLKFQGIRQALKASVGVELTREMYHTILERYFEISAAYAPDLVEEVRGFAEGADVDRLDLFSLSCFLDLNDLKFPDVWARVDPGGCTSFGLEVAQSKAIAAQTYDVSRFWLDGLIMLQVQMSDGSALLTPTIAGMVGSAGINSHGLALMINKLTPRDSGPGVPHNFLARRALEQRTLGAAIDSILGVKRASGTHFTLCDHEGNLVGLETAASSHAVFQPSRGFVAHTNHFLDSKLHHEIDLTSGRNGESVIRLERIERLLRRLVSGGEPDSKRAVEMAQRALQDHAHYPTSICRHAFEGEDERACETIAALIAIPHRRELLATCGQACSADFVRYSLRDAEEHRCLTETEASNATS